MQLLTYLLVFVEILTCFLLIGVVLLQRSRSGGGAGMAFGAGMGESLFGAQAGNVLTKTTVVLGIVFLVNTTLLAMIGAVGREHSVADRLPAGAPFVPQVPQQPQQQIPAEQFAPGDDMFAPEMQVTPQMPEAPPQEMPPMGAQELIMPVPPAVDEAVPED